MTKIYFFLLTAFFYNTSEAQKWLWAKNVSYNSNSAGNNCLTSAGNGDFYLSTNTDSGAYLLKFDSLGTELWRKEFTGNVEINELTVSGNHIYATGSFAGISKINNTIKSAGEEDIFLAKYTIAGNFAWLKTMGGKGQDVGNTICADNSGNIYLAGTYSDTSYFGNNILLITKNHSKTFVTKYDSEGSIIFVKGSGTMNSLEGSSTPTKIRINRNGIIHLIGNYSDVLFGAFHLSTLDLFGGEYLAQIDSTGTILSLRSIAVGHFFNRDIAFDQSQNLLLSGYSGGVNGSWSYTNKYTPAGQLIYSSSLHGTCYNDVYEVCSIASNNNNCFVAGLGQKSGNCGQKAADFLFFAKYDEQGKRQILETLKCNVNNVNIISDNNNGFIICGKLNSDFKIGNNSLTSVNNQIFIARFRNTSEKNSVVSKKSSENKIEIFPNSINGSFTIRFAGAKSRDSKFLVRNSLGEVICSKNITDRSHEFDISRSPKGLYQVEVIENNQLKEVKKLVFD